MRPIIKTILDAVGANGAGTPIRVRLNTDNEVLVDTDGGGDADMDLKFQVAYSKIAPDFDAAQSPSNPWYYVRVKDLNEGDIYDGDVGIGALITSADLNQNFNVEANS